MLFGPKKYIYLSVFFQKNRNPYVYRTDDKSVKVNDVVMVPVPDGDPKPAIVAEVKVCTKKDAPCPPEQTKMIIGRADRKNRKLFAGVDMRRQLAGYPNRKIFGTKKSAAPADDLAWIDELEFLDAIFDDR